MVAGDHRDLDAGVVALLDGLRDFRARGIHQAHDADERQVALELLALVGLVSVELSHAEGERAVPRGGELLVGRGEPGAQLLGHGNVLAAQARARAQREHDVGAALHVGDATAVDSVHGGHALALGVERHLSHARGLEMSGREIVRSRDERGLGGVAHELALGGVVCVVAGGGDLEKELVVRLMRRCGARLDSPVRRHGGCVGPHEQRADGHAIQRERAGLVRTDERGRAECLDRVQATHERVVLRHPAYSQRERHGDDRRQPLGDGGHCERHGDEQPLGHVLSEGVVLEHREKRARLGLRREEDLLDEDDRCDDQDDDRDALAHDFELGLERRDLVAGAGQQVGDVAHLGVLAGSGHEHAAATDRYRRAGEDHVAPVAERHVLAFDDVAVFADRLALAGERALDHAKSGGLDKPPVGRDAVARLEQHHVAGHEVLGAHVGLNTVADNGGGGSGELLERFERLLGPVLLDEAEHPVEKQDRKDGDGFDHLSLDRRDDHGEQQDVDHEVLELRDEQAPRRRFLLLFKAVWPELGVAPDDLFRGEALQGIGIQLPCDLAGGERVPRGAGDLRRGDRIEGRRCGLVHSRLLVARGLGGLIPPRVSLLTGRTGTNSPEARASGIVGLPPRARAPGATPPRLLARYPRSTHAAMRQVDHPIS